ncbi:unnamed protein product [Gadus morhua 'NCC']
MADTRKTVVKVLICVEKVTSFASSVYPIFGIISPLVLHGKMEDISAKNQQCLQKIRIDEVNETYGKYEEFIKHQYAALGNMVTKVKKDPDHADKHMSDFEKIYERDKADESLNTYYRGVMGGSLFARPLLLVYLKHCGQDFTVMERRCSHLRLLFHKGLFALMAYTAMTKDDEEEVAEKWKKRMEEIQRKMEEVLSQCKEASPP